MTRIENFAATVTAAHSYRNLGSMDNIDKLHAVKSFYKSNGLELPATVTFTKSKRIDALTKNDLLEVLKDSELNAAYVNALKNGEEKITLTKTVSYNDALVEFGEGALCGRLIDNLTSEQHDKLRAVKSFDIPAKIALNEIPKFIEALQKIYNEAQK